MKIRIKVKYLVIIIFLCTSLIFIWTFARGYAVLGAVKFFDGIGIMDKANIYYGKIAEGGFGEASMLAEKQRIENILKEGKLKYDQYYQISSLIHGSGGFVGYKTLDIVNERYNSFASHAYDSISFREYTMGAALLNWFGGNADNAINLMKNITFKDIDELEQLRCINLANMYMAMGEMEKFREILEPYLRQEDYYIYYRNILMMRYYLMKGQVDEAEKYSSSNIKERQKKYKNDIAIKSAYANPVKFDSYFEENLLNLYKSTDNIKSNNRVFGRILEEGKPMKNTIVFLKEISHMNSSSSIPGQHDGIKFFGVTDENGYYEINNITDGIYGLIAYIPYQRVKGKNILLNEKYNLEFTGQEKYEENIEVLKPFEVQVVENEEEGTVTFTWDDENKNIEYYVLNISEIKNSEDNQYISNNRFQSPRIYGNSYTLNIEDERKNSFRAGISYTSNGVEPVSFLEPLYHTGKYSYIIYGYKNEDIRLAYSSSGIYPNRELDNISINGQEWAEQDRLLLDRKWEEAIAGYERILSENPDDIHALKVLSIIYFNGYKFTQDGELLNKKDRNKSLPLLQRLDRLIDNETVKYLLAGLYLDSKEYKKSLELYEYILNNNGSPYFNRSIGEIYLYLNDYKQAQRYFENYFEHTGSGAENLIILGILKNDMQLSEEAAAEYDSRTYYADYNSLLKEYISMNRKGYEEFFELIRVNRIEDAEKWITDKDDSLGVFYKGIIQLNKHLDRRSKEALYKTYHDSVGNDILSELMKNLGKGKLNSGYGG